MAAPLQDARALLARFERHFEEFKHLLSGLWNISVLPSQDENFECLLVLDRERLVAARPILADAANNLSHTLDMTLGCLTRLRGNPNPGWYYPVPEQSEAFAAQIERWAPLIGTNAIARILAAHDQQKPNVPHLRVVKKIARSGKHWMLLATSASALGVQVHQPRPRIFQIPQGYFLENDSFTFYEGPEDYRKTQMYTVIGLSIDGLAEGLPKSPDTCLDCGARYVRGILNSVCDEHGQPTFEAS